MHRIPNPTIPKSKNPRFRKLENQKHQISTNSKFQKPKTPKSQNLNSKLQKYEIEKTYEKT